MAGEVFLTNEGDGIACLRLLQVEPFAETVLSRSPFTAGMLPFGLQVPFNAKRCLAAVLLDVLLVVSTNFDAAVRVVEYDQDTGATTRSVSMST